ncbi:glycoside hydrolase family 28 protein / polygalacturonase (pectinase) family protein [Corchorus olitorius]|uniref:Glycoside hydrolase family 28 protein / polygalacturonase (Pectinase) family protein n=1 Tax=Corchorus olitorius TaxID=93759 RepID=A0A1R3I5G5_9ROSI|nr:glycoside hydrolase family 28 protein / polygalacturonase (pectinase) family protein [Corchorus olitorius]
MAFGVGKKKNILLRQLVNHSCSIRRETSSSPLLRYEHFLRLGIMFVAEKLKKFHCSRETFLLHPVTFNGPCKAKEIDF